MKLLNPLIERFFPPIQPLPVGVYHYQAPPDAAFPYRLHLRIEPGGSGVLIVNASTVVHLNPTAAEYAYHLVQNTPEAQAITTIARRYRVKKELVRQDYQEMIGKLRTLVDLPDLDPVAFLDFGRDEPYSGAVSAPYRLDCALTYQLPVEGAAVLAPVDRVKRQLTAGEWKTIIDKAWNAGIPHVIFTGGEPTLRPDLSELIAHAESLGMVTGVITSGYRLCEKGYCQALLQAGLDHIMILLDPDEEFAWEALRDMLAEDIAVVVHLTLTRRWLERYDPVLARLVQMGVENISLSAEGVELREELKAKRQALADNQIHLIWDMPVPYSQFHPVAVELSETADAFSDAGPDDTRAETAGPGQAWLYVEPDGDVLPGQGYYQDVLGSLLTDPWEAIWQRAKDWKQSR